MTVRIDRSLPSFLGGRLLPLLGAVALVLGIACSVPPDQGQGMDPSMPGPGTDTTQQDDPADSISQATTVADSVADVTDALSQGTTEPGSEAADDANTGSVSMDGDNQVVTESVEGIVLPQSLPPPDGGMINKFLIFSPDSAKNAGYIAGQKQVNLNTKNPARGDSELLTWYGKQNVTDMANGTGYRYRNMRFDQNAKLVHESRNGQALKLTSYPPADLLPAGVTLPKGTNFLPPDPQNPSKTITLPMGAVLWEVPITIVQDDPAGNLSGSARDVHAYDAITKLQLFFQHARVVTDKTSKAQYLNVTSYYNYDNKKPKALYDIHQGPKGVSTMLTAYSDQNNVWTGAGTWVSADGTVNQSIGTVTNADHSYVKTVKHNLTGNVATFNFNSDRSGSGQTVDKNGKVLFTTTWDTSGKGTLTFAPRPWTIKIPKKLPFVYQKADKKGNTVTLNFTADGSGTGSVTTPRGDVIASFTWDKTGAGTITPAPRPFHI